MIIVSGKDKLMVGFINQTPPSSYSTGSVLLFRRCQKSSRIMKKAASYDDYLLFFVVFTGFIDLFIKKTSQRKLKRLCHDERSSQTMKNTDNRDDSSVLCRNIFSIPDGLNCNGSVYICIWKIFILQMGAHFCIIKLLALYIREC